MPTYSAPGHPDCRINCPAGGFAIYVKPYGPCEVGCDDPGSRLAKALKSNPARRMDFRIAVTGRPAMLRLCRALQTIPISRNDRLALVRAMRNISKPISPGRRSRVARRPLRFLSVHKNATVSALIKDIAATARPDGEPFGGPEGGGQGPRPSPSPPALRRVNQVVGLHDLSERKL